MGTSIVAAMQLINAKDKRGKLPLDLALEASAGAVVALLTFYGAGRGCLRFPYAMAPWLL